MRIKDGLKLEPVFNIPLHGITGVEIPNALRTDFPPFLAEMGYKVGVEIGIDRGEYGVELCKAGLKMFGVDPFVQYAEYKEKSRYQSHYEEAKTNLKGYDYTIIRKFSMDALNDFEDNSLDFVYIDGNHTLPYIAQDIFGWERKVRKGGIVSGHDYAIVRGPREREDPKVFDGTHVKFAVDSFAYIARVSKLYVLGKRTGKKETERDKWRSWFFFKEWVS